MSKYEDIIGLSHKQSAKRAHMSNRARAAQFSSFEALTGHDEAIEETARVIDGRIILGGYEAEALNCKLQRVIDKNITAVMATYFVYEQKYTFTFQNVKKHTADRFVRSVLMRDTVALFC